MFYYSSNFYPVVLTSIDESELIRMMMIANDNFLIP